MRGRSEMKINFTKEEYRKLLDIIYAGIMVINGNKAPEDYLEEYEDMEQYIYSFASHYGHGNLVDYDPKYKRYFTTPEFDKERIEDLIQEYDDIIFWSMLAFNLAKRDVYRDLEGKKIDRETILKGIIEKEAEYRDEFYENGLENLIFKNLK